MHRTHHTRARKQCPQNAQHEGGEHQPHIPHLHHPAFLLHHHRMQKRSPRNPRQQRRIFHRIPSPIPTPPQNRISPVRPQKDPHTLKSPSHHGPAASDVNPFFARIAAQ